MKKTMSCSVRVYKNALFYVHKMLCRAEYVYIAWIIL